MDQWGISDFVFVFTDAGEGIRLENAWYEKCLTHDATQNLILGRDCNLADDFQEWRWIENLLLQNVGSGKCLKASSTGTTFEIQECVFSTNSQRYTCMFNLIKTFRETYLALDISFQLVGSGTSEKVRWRVFPASNDNPICNTTGMFIMDLSSPLQMVFEFLSSQFCNRACRQIRTKITRAG